jgi:hypothetical protein
VTGGPAEHSRTNWAPLSPGRRAWRRTAPLLAFAGIASAAAAAALELARICAAGRGLPMWDRADHGLAGFELARALSRGDVLGFLLDLNRQVTWPFVHSLLLAPWLLVRGTDIVAADQLSSLLFAGTVLAVFAAGLRLHPTRGAWVGAAAGALALLAPDYRLFGTLAMLEMPGAFFLALTLALWLREAESPAPKHLTAAAGLSTTALFLCKYNYGLLWTVPLAWHVWSSAEISPKQEVLARGRAALRERRWVRPFPLFLLAYALVLVGILVSGGGVFRIWGARVSVRSPGNPAYLLYLILLAWGVMAVRRAGGARSVWRRIPPRYRILIATVLLPLGVWFLIPVPNRVKEFFGFVVNRRSGPPLWTLDGLLFYPRAFVHGYAPSPLAGWLVLALACVPPAGRRAADRLLYGAFAFGLLATMAHHYHDPRFLFTTALLVWLRAAQTAIGWLGLMLDRLHKVAWLEEAAWAAALAGLLAWGWLAAPARPAVAAAHREQNSPDVFVTALDRLMDSSLGAKQGTIVLGCSNWLSPALLHWEALRRRPDLPVERLPRRAPWLPEGASDADIAARIERLRASGLIVIAVVPAGCLPATARDYRSEVWADSVTAARLATSPGVVKETEESLGGADFPLRLSVFRFVTTGAATAGTERSAVRQ